METGDMIISLITFLFFVFLFFNPFLKKLNREAEKQKKAAPATKPLPEEDKVNRAAIRQTGPVEKKEGPVTHLVHSVKAMEKPASLPLPKQTGGLERIESLPPLKRALVWSEILNRKFE